MHNLAFGYSISEMKGGKVVAVRSWTDRLELFLIGLILGLVVEQISGLRRSEVGKGL